MSVYVLKMCVLSPDCHITPFGYVSLMSYPGVQGALCLSPADALSFPRCTTSPQFFPLCASIQCDMACTPLSCLVNFSQKRSVTFGSCTKITWLVT